MNIGINACYHDVLPDDQMDQIAALGPGTVVRAAVTNLAAARRIGDACAKRGLHPLFLIEAPDLQLLRALLPAIKDYAADVELGNELDLTGMSPVAFRTWVISAHNVLRQEGATGQIWSGGVANAGPQTLVWLQRAGVMSWPTGLGVAFHIYGTRGSSVEMATRMHRLTTAMRPRPIAITEWGYDFAPSSLSWWDRLLGRHPVVLDESVAAWNIRSDQCAFIAYGMQLACYYQWTDGPGTTAIDRFGLRTLSGRLRPTYTSLWTWTAGSTGTAPLS